MSVCFLNLICMHTHKENLTLFTHEYIKMYTSITNSRQNGFISEFFLRFNIVIFGGIDGFSRMVLSKSEYGLFLNLKSNTNVLVKTLFNFLCKTFS